MVFLVPGQTGQSDPVVNHINKGYYQHSPSKVDLGKDFGLSLKIQKCFLVVSRNDLALGDPLQVLESLGTPEPSWVVASQPTLGNTIAPLHEDLVSCHLRRRDRVRIVIHFL